jgi:hypothetical protein
MTVPFSKRDNCIYREPKGLQLNSFDVNMKQKSVQKFGNETSQRGEDQVPAPNGRHCSKGKMDGATRRCSQFSSCNHPEVIRPRTLLQTVLEAGGACGHATMFARLRFDLLLTIGIAIFRCGVIFSGIMCFSSSH